MEGMISLGCVKESDNVFWKQVHEDPYGCWTWMGPGLPTGYGLFTWKGVTRRAHRVAYALAHPDWDGTSLVCHRCNNPRCVRPDHLFAGTTADSMKNKILKGRANCSPLTEQDVRVIRLSQESCRSLAKQFNVSAMTISQIRNRITWRHLD